MHHMIAISAAPGMHSAFGVMCTHNMSRDQLCSLAMRVVYERTFKTMWCSPEMQKLPWIKAKNWNDIC